MNQSYGSNPEPHMPQVKGTGKASSSVPDEMPSYERKTDTKPSSPQKRPRGRPPKDPLSKRTRKQKKAEELDQITKCRVFFPTEEEFADFAGFITYCES